MVEIRDYLLERARRMDVRSIIENIFQAALGRFTLTTEVQSSSERETPGGTPGGTPGETP